MRLVPTGSMQDGAQVYHSADGRFYVDSSVRSQAVGRENRRVRWWVASDLHRKEGGYFVEAARATTLTALKERMAKYLARHP